MKNITLTAIYEPCAEGGYIAYIEEIPGINTQGESLDEAKYSPLSRPQIAPEQCMVIK